MFKKATKSESKLRMAIAGVSGSGKTYTSLLFARELGKKIAVIDTERGSASKYSDIFDFDVLELSEFSIGQYIAAIKAAEEAGYDVLVIDSLSHAWSGEGGALSQVDAIAAKSQSSNTFGAWRQVTPLQNKLVDTILGVKMHVIATMRSKTEYVIEDVTDRSGKSKKTPRKVGLAPVQRDGIEYEFDVICEMLAGSSISVTKSRCPALSDKYETMPGASFVQPLNAWLGLSKESQSAKNVEPAPMPETPQQSDEVQQKQAQSKAIDFDALIEKSKTHDELRALYVRALTEWSHGGLSKEKVYEYKTKIQAKVHRLSDATPAQGGAV